MSKQLVYIFLLLTSVILHAQEIPKIKVGEKHISVKKLHVKTIITGDIATTTFDMHFYNPNNRVLEGNLIFPLGEGQSVTAFSLEINDRLRKAVIVEKERARVAFETTVRTKIDPALLEQTKGNNYKARIYPIPAKGYKRVVVEFQQKLLINSDSYYYKLPFSFKNKLEKFSLSINVLNQNKKPILKKGFNKEFVYDANKNSFYLNVNKNRQRVSKPVLIEIPLNHTKEKILTYKNYLYFTKKMNFKKVSSKLKKKITILWDKSLSQKSKNVKRELALLTLYFKEVKNCKVDLILFNTEIRAKERFSIVNGNWNKLRTKLENVVYDGASSFNFLSNYKSYGTLNMVFTDGLNTLSTLKYNFNKNSYVINSSESANHILLKNKAEQSGGAYLNLSQTSIKQAFTKFIEKKVQILGTNLAGKEIEFYPKKGSVVNSLFFICGKGNFINKRIKIYLGNGVDTLKTISFKINRRTKNHELVSKIWAQNKMNDLIIESEKNKEEILQLSKKYQIISPFTSMLILDRIEDYVTHNIKPPSELQEKYEELLAQKVNNKKQLLNNLKDDLFREYNLLFKWYDKDFNPPKISKKVVLKRSKIINNQFVITNTAESVNDTILQRGEFFTNGIVSDVSEPLPGVTILVKGSTTGTETDFDGKYSIKVKTGDELVFSFPGMKTIQKGVGVSNRIDILMEDDNLLDEVVITAYATSRVTNVASSSVSVLREESIVNENLQGAMPRVNMNKSGIINSIETNSLNIENNEPLYVVDGIQVTKKPTLSTDKIHSLYSLTSDQGVSIFGQKGKNGILVYITKQGHEKKLADISDFEELVKEKIELKGWNPKTPYLKLLNTCNNTEEAYAKYIYLRNNYGKSPSFYIDVADFFRKNNNLKLATQILSNVAEIDLDNYELLKALAYKFEEYKLYEHAVFIYKEILKLRPEDIQSYRDLALVYEHVGEYQKSVDLLYKIVNGELLEKDENRRFSGIETIALSELNRMINLYNDKLVISHIDKSLLKIIKTDIRVLIDWNHNDTDIDLWVIDPNGEKCFYKHKKTKIGGLMSKDMIDGFGPEQFILKKGIQGKYKIKIKYFSNDKEKISGPTFLKITMFKYFGSKNEVIKQRLVRLTNVKEILDLGEVILN
ncbi:VIT domain-containing protein [Tenacibaculum sp. nBUS_03]|uniref:VIT domain-containing protein n=1 Tax=Tenacibaculum sp. nBUS_03 TaxID=3395320 RepID=UPI003EBDE9E2